MEIVLTAMSMLAFPASALFAAKLLKMAMRRSRIRNQLSRDRECVAGYQR